MNLLIALATLVGGLITVSRYASCIQCEVSLPQDSTPECKALRNATLVQNKKTFTFKYDPSLYDFATINMTQQQLAEVTLNDPFTRYYVTAYSETNRASASATDLYINITAGQEITDLSEYLKLEAFFRSAMEPVIGQYAKSPSNYEAFIDDRTAWISDKYFTQQRLAGANPMSLRRVTIHGQEKRRCIVKTTDGRWCHFPFTYRGEIYHNCTTAGHFRPWCSTTKAYRGRRGKCNENNNANQEAGNCSVKTTRGEWCHFPFTYRGTVYHSCTSVDNHRPWCSTTANFYRQWGNCRGEEEKQGPVGLDWNKLKNELNPNFEWAAAVKAALKTEDSLEDTINQGRIYALRYELSDDLPREPDLTDRDPRRTMWNVLSPIALFVSAKVPGRSGNELVPVAIQMDYSPDSAVYTPSDGDNWMIAKLNLQITDLQYVQIVEHLAKVHFLMEAFCVSLKRHLPPLHPLNQILKYHCREITVPNVFGGPSIVGEGQFMDLLFANGNTGAFRLFRDVGEEATWEVTDFKAEIKKRGLDDKVLIPFFPYRDDGELIIGVIRQLAEDYVDLYYKADRDVQEDTELQAYVNELSLNGTGPNGGLGRIKKFPASIKSKEELSDIVGRIIGQLSVQHACLNYQLADYVRYIPNLPTKLYNDTRVKDGEFSVYRLPNRLTSALEARFSNSPAAFRFDSLFDYGNELQDNKATNLINSYYSYLMHEIQPRMQKMNKLRKENGDLTYPYLIPRWLPNGCQT